MNQKKEEIRKGIFETLYSVDVTPFLEQKGKLNLTYLKWASAFRLLLHYYPRSTWRNLEHMEIDHAVAPATVAGFIVGTEVTVTDGDTTITRVETLPVMDYNNTVILKPTAFDINSAIKRCYVKTIAHHGLGLRVFENEPHIVEEEEGSLPSPAEAVEALYTTEPEPELEDHFVSPAAAVVKPKLTKDMCKKFVKHVKDNGVAQTDAVALLKKHGYARSAEIPQERFEFFKSQIYNMRSHNDE